MTKLKRVFLLLLLIGLVLMVACKDKDKKTEAGADSGDNNGTENAEDNVNLTGMPIVNEPITISFMARKGPESANNYNEVLIWKEYEEMTGIHVDWEIVPRDGFEEKRNLALGSDQLPDVFYTAAMSNLDIQKYGDQGSFVRLNDYIEEYMPNLHALMEEDPSIRKGLTFPDGSIYSLPTIYSPDFKSVLAGHKGWVRSDWLEILDMDVPDTTEDFYQYLKAVKETDLIGDGSNKEIPYGGYRTYALTTWLQGAFGVGNKGIKHPFLDEDPETGDLRFYPIADGYRDMLEYVHKLYDEELILPNIFTVEGDQNYSLGSEGLYGSTVINNPEAQFDNEEGRYVGMPALEGPNGDRIYTYVTSPLAQIGGFVVTKENQHVEATLRWMDYFYSDEGAKLFFMGKEGVTYEVKEDGEIDYLDEIKNDPNLTLDQKLADYVTWLGGGYPGIVKEDFFKGSESLPSSLEATEKFEADIPDELWPLFTFTTEESNRLAALSADIEKYVEEMKDKFITGDESLDDWDKYVETLEKMGLDDYMEIQNKAYERYKSN